MGVKSTVFLSYREAVEKFGELKAAIQKDKFVREAENFYYEYELEEELERLNDLLHGGEGFENYIIGEKGVNNGKSRCKILEWLVGLPYAISWREEQQRKCGVDCQNRKAH